MIKPKYKLLHEEAMDFVDKAKLIASDEATRIEFFQEALDLEKEAATNAPLSDAKNFSKSLYYRSAANLAYRIQVYEQAFQLANTGLQFYTPVFLQKQLEELITRIQIKKLNME